MRSHIMARITTLFAGLLPGERAKALPPWHPRKNRGNRGSSFRPYSGVARGLSGRYMEAESRMIYFLPRL
ncbi:MAG: hypothetical protein HYY21_00030 [Candidatus Tectomicrobia bacterium]|nr:hypothetical protein [Candidatus Tectomicrobia bacterium]